MSINLGNLLTCSFLENGDSPTQAECLSDPNQGARGQDPSRSGLVLGDRHAPMPQPRSGIDAC